MTMDKVIEAAARDDLSMHMLAAWLNVRVDQIPPENKAHLNATTMAAWQRVGEAAIAAYRKQREEDGFVEVPREPTEAMMDAGSANFDSYHDCSEQFGPVWRAMIAAAAQGDE